MIDQNKNEEYLPKVSWGERFRRALGLSAGASKEAQMNQPVIETSFNHANHHILHNEVIKGTNFSLPALLDAAKDGTVLVSRPDEANGGRYYRYLSSRKVAVADGEFSEVYCVGAKEYPDGDLEIVGEMPIEAAFFKVDGTQELSNPEIGLQPGSEVTIITPSDTHSGMTTLSDKDKAIFENSMRVVMSIDRQVTSD